MGRLPFAVYTKIKNMQSIRDKEDIKVFVNTFYQAVQEDDLIGPIFEEKVNGNWPKHLEKMYGFWNTVLFAQRDYKGNPFQPHANLPINGDHFKRWLEILNQTIISNFEGEKAEEILWRADKMATLFQRKLAMHRGGNFKSII